MKTSIYEDIQVGDVFYPAYKGAPIHVAPSKTARGRYNFIAKLSLRTKTALCADNAYGSYFICFIKRRPLPGEAIEIETVQSRSAYGRLIEVNDK